MDPSHLIGLIRDEEEEEGEEDEERNMFDYKNIYGMLVRNIV